MVEVTDCPTVIDLQVLTGNIELVERYNRVNNHLILTMDKLEKY